MTTESIRWWHSRRKRHCPHVRVLGIYGDAINHTPGFRRNRCQDCGRLLDGPVSISESRSDVGLT